MPFWYLLHLGKVTQTHSLNIHTQPEASCMFQGFICLSYFVYASSEGSDKTAQMCMLVEHQLAGYMKALMRLHRCTGCL